MTGILGATELDRLGIKYKTDKSSRKHDYLRFYELFLAPFKNDEFLCLELGVGPQVNKGKSLLAFCDYFPRAQLVGVDIRPDAKDVESDRIHVELGDLGSRAFLHSLAEKYEPRVIIDDASHLWSHQLLSLSTLFPALEPGGVFVVEDIHTSFQPLAAEYGDTGDDAASYLCRLAMLVAGGRRTHASYANAPPPAEMVILSESVDAISFYKNTAILVKKAQTGR